MKSLTKDRIHSMLSGAHQRGEIILATVSGVLTTTCDMIRYADKHLDAIDVITTKSFQVMPNPGNREPILTEPEPGCFGNSVGLRNPGLEQAFRQLQQLRRETDLRTLLVVSISGSSPEEFITLARALEPVSDILELNFSCPHAAEGYGSSIGGSWRIASSYMEKIRRELGDDFTVPIFAKLTPNTDELPRIARCLMGSGADGLAGINTVGPELYIEPHSGKPILLNSLGGRGGKSGNWIFREALDALKDVRSAVGEEVVILGMGGVSDGKDAARMVSSGADTVGIGSAFAKVNQRFWGAYTRAVKQEASAILSGTKGKAVVTGPSSRSYISRDRSMEFQSYQITSIVYHTPLVSLITLDGALSYEAGEFVFLWVPEVGEKPFSPALNDPLTFLIKRRGPLSEYLCSMKAGDTLYVRGLYGGAAMISPRQRALLIAGGTGIAVIPALARSLSDAGKDIEMFYGSSDSGEPGAPLKQELQEFGVVTTVLDRGVPGRVLETALEEAAGCAVYLVGPEAFMERGAAMAREQGIDASSIFLSLEQTTLCGVGLCGACSCGGKLTCQYGTFVTFDDYIGR